MSGLQDYHQHLDATPDTKSHAIVAIVLALAMSGLGFYVYKAVWNPTTHTIVSNGQIPR